MFDSSGRPRSGHPLVLFAIVLLAFVLRIAWLGRESLWYDEAFTLRFARRTFGAMYALLVREAWDPPVYPTAVWTWVRLVGAGDWQVRLVSVIAGTLAVFGVHGLARRLYDVRTAHLAALLAAISQVLIAYSQEARCYSVLLALLLATACLYVDALRERARGRTWWGFVVLAALATLTHYYAVFFLLALALFTVSTSARKAIPPRRLLAGTALYALLLAPWLASGVIASAASQPVAQFEHVAPWFSVDLWTFLRTMDDFHGGRMEGLFARAPAWTYPAGALLFALPALLGLRSLVSRSATRDEKAGTALLALLWLVPMACLLVLGFLKIQFATRYVLFCAVPYLVLVARGLTSLGLAARTAFLAGIVAWSALSVRALYTIPHKEDWRGALRELSVEVRPGDRVLFLPFGDVPLEWPVYHPDGPELDVVSLDEPERIGGDRLWVLTYERVPVDDARVDRAREILGQRRKARESNYFLVRLELFLPP
ncbi:MAG: glycosyltransferase family 39 protein [Planctomycetota bacterium]